MDFLLVVAVYILLGVLAHLVRKRLRQAVDAPPDNIKELYGTQYWHDDWNKQFVALGGKPVLTEDEEAIARVTLRMGPPPKMTDTYRKAVWKDHDGEVIRSWQGGALRVTYGPQNPTPRPLKCDLCGLPHRTEICDEYDLWEDDDDE